MFLRGKGPYSFEKLAIFDESVKSTTKLFALLMKSAKTGFRDHGPAFLLHVLLNGLGGL